MYPVNSMEFLQKNIVLLLHLSIPIIRLIRILCVSVGYYYYYLVGKIFFFVLSIGLAIVSICVYHNA